VGGCKECDMDFEYNPVKTYTNEITQSVGPTTSLTSRQLVDTDTSHYIYLDATNGDDANSGFAPDQAKKTFDAAFSAMAGVRYVIHILDSSTYTRSTLADFNSANKSGIQAALGQTPIINFTGTAELRLSDTSGGGKFLSGVIITSDQQGAVVIIDSQAGTTTITDCYIYNAGDKGACLEVTPEDTASCYILYNILATTGIAGYNMQLQMSSGTNLVKGNVFYNIFIQPDKYSDDSFSMRVYLGGGNTLQLDFDAPTLVATINGGSTITSFAPGFWAGYIVYITGVGYYKIVNNTSTQLFLEDIYNTAGASIVNANSTIRDITMFYNIVTDRFNNTTTATIEKNIFIGNGNNVGIMQNCYPSITSNTLIIRGNVFLNLEYGYIMTKITLEGSADIGTAILTENLMYTTYEDDYAWPNGEPITPDAGMSYTSSVIDSDIVPLYFNQQCALIPDTVPPYVDALLGYVKCAYDFRLRQKGKKYYSTDTQIMILDSPLLGLYTTPDPDEDLCPWEETMVESALTYADTITLEYPPKGIQIAFDPKNPVNLDDLHGNPNTDYDAIRKMFTFDFRSYTSNENIWKLHELLQTKSVKRFYPLGKGYTMMTGSSSGTLAGVTSTTATFVPSPLPVYFAPYHWIGFWMILYSSGFERHYYISNNNKTTFNLIDKLGVGFPGDGTYTFAIEYILVQNEMKPLAFKQDNFTSFLYGGAWQEKDDTARHEYTDTTVTFKEHENPV